MLERLRSQIGTAGLIVAIVALVAALGGGAYAATSNSGKATASAKQGKQGKQGKPGKTGPAGPAGPAGPQGPAGAAGAKGDTGAQGAVGSVGPAGATGPAGPKGPSGFGETLPTGKTETGVFGIYPQNPTNEGTYYAIPISFTLPLAEAPEPILLKEGELTKPGCPGIVEGVPQADPGKLCVYASKFEGTPDNYAGSGGFTYGGPAPVEGEFGEVLAGVSPVGTVFSFKCEIGFCNVVGSWAVTAD